MKSFGQIVNEYPPLNLSWVAKFDKKQPDQGFFVYNRLITSKTAAEWVETIQKIKKDAWNRDFIMSFNYLASNVKGGFYKNSATVSGDPVYFFVDVTLKS